MNESATQSVREIPQFLWSLCVLCSTSLSAASARVAFMILGASDTHTAPLDPAANLGCSPLHLVDISAEPIYGKTSALAIKVSPQQIVSQYPHNHGSLEVTTLRS